MRKPTPNETEVLSILLLKAGFNIDPHSLSVTAMSDGGMGSLKIGETSHDRKFGSMAAEIQFVDSDGVKIIASLYLDEDGAPYELDIFKTNFGVTDG